MERASCLRLIEAIKAQLAACEREISALAREALCPYTSAARRMEAFIVRAEIQTRTVSLSRDLQTIETSLAAADRLAQSGKQMRFAFEPPKKPPQSEGMREVLRLYPSRNAGL